ncbi:glucosyl-dolichyl phosphate glucuronosyltransferase [Halorarius halobius]|uniref:glucosyl-dolichyl phosphate glucuronosyltransferase n=1 Tax=Halorarius halobius TaxID=2962671 RepID=UPI0020CCE1F7|nr:glucosyl-dolichyl phosphate glucuronosyltransferase [Halorarius halobius]
MRVSVVLCEHTTDRYEDLREAADAVLAQTHDEVELVLVSDGSPAVADRMRRDYGDDPAALVHELDENLGLLGARNAGAEAATGDVVAFLDDDAVPADDWVKRLVDAYETHDVPAVGGKMTPRWVAGKPGFLPAEFYWLVGVTHRGFRETPGEVRNTNGSNLSFRREVFLELGGFEGDIGGRKGDANLQGGETELCARLEREYGHGVWYVPDAEVEHKVFDYRTDPWWLLDRAFWQGYSKRGMEKFVEGSTDEEGEFLGQLLGEFAPARLRRLVRDPGVEAATQLVMLFVFTAAVGAGYGYGLLKWR